MRNCVLEVIIDEFDYFKEHKSHLAWALMHFDMIHRASRLAYNACQDNVNDLYRKVVEEFTEEDEYLFSDAWDITQIESEGGNYKDFDPKNPVSQAIINFHTSMRKKYPEQKDTYLSKKELIERHSYMDCGTSISDLAGYTVAEKYVRKDIKEKILTLSKDQFIAPAIKQYQNLGKKKKK